MEQEQNTAQILSTTSWCLFGSFLGTVSVVYLVFLVTVKAAHLGIHLEYNWFTENEFFVPGKIV